MRVLSAWEDQLAQLPPPVEAYLFAYNARDVDGMLACLSANVSFKDIAGGTVTAKTRGVPAFETLARHSAAAFAHRTQTVLNTITVDDTTLVEVAFSGIVAMDLPNGWSAGNTVALSGTSLFQTMDGKIARIVDQRG